MFGFFKKAKAGDKAQEAQAAPEGEQGVPQPYTASDLGRARHEVEFNQFREFFFTNPTGFVDALMQEFGLCELHYEALKHFKVKTRYGAGPYKVANGKTTRGNYIFRGKLPVPENLGVCYRIYLAFDADFTQLAYYVVERTEDGAQLCELDADGACTVVQAVEEPLWENATKEQKAEEVALVMRLYEGDPVEPEEDAAEDAVEADTDPAEAPEDGAVDDEPAVDGEPAEDGEPSDNPHA